MKQPKYLKYTVIIDGDVAQWNGHVYATCHENAFDQACQIAEGLGGDFLDVLMCYQSDEDK